MPNMQLLKVAFNAIFSPYLQQAAKLKNPVFSSSLYQTTKPKIVISGYTVQRKSVSVTPQSLHFYVQSNVDKTPTGSNEPSLLPQVWEKSFLGGWKFQQSDRPSGLFLSRTEGNDSYLRLLCCSSTGVAEAPTKVQLVFFSDLPVFHVLHS